jgi:hypothetical protein
MNDGLQTSYFLSPQPFVPPQSSPYACAPFSIGRSGNRADQLQSLAEGEFMANLKGLASIVSQLRIERTNLGNQLSHVDAALSVLGKLNGGSYTKPRRTLSASARRRISLAQKARWAKRKTSGQAARPKRTISASARRKIAAAQRARWARVKAAQK